MKQTTIDKIINNHNMGIPYQTRKYTYKLQYHPMEMTWYIIRCPKGKENIEFLVSPLFEGDNPTIANYWEWYLPIKF